MKVTDTDILDVKLIEPTLHGDERGFFLESFHAERYRTQVGIELDFVQDNHSRSSKGVLRGLHFQKEHPQGKLVRVVRGAVYDVAVDIRPNSDTFGVWVGYELSEKNARQLWVPPGLAHGFLVLSDTADFEYKCTNYYDPQDEGCVLWSDPELNIAWPSKTPTLSNKDRVAPMLSQLDLL